jgi:hypothetical protein
MMEFFEHFTNIEESVVLLAKLIFKRKKPHFAYHALEDYFNP